MIEVYDYLIYINNLNAKQQNSLLINKQTGSFVKSTKSSINSFYSIRNTRNVLNYSDIKLNIH